MTRSCLDKPACTVPVFQAIEDRILDCACIGASKQVTETVYLPARCPDDCSPETVTGWSQTGNCQTSTKPIVVTDPPPPSTSIKPSYPPVPTSTNSDDGGY
ncbi:hypothetical protein TWF694_010916 [Orbilia ellipsospora]|uniref:Uncharacterized protein n=1 Tax=Orbilia ellipsospora TaxID=2528407 RepID=A0AAV9XDN9_9PEZI